jgi:hypothetical protein
VAQKRIRSEAKNIERHVSISGLSQPRGSPQKRVEKSLDTARTPASQECVRHIKGADRLAWNFFGLDGLAARDQSAESQMADDLDQASVQVAE